MAMYSETESKFKIDAEIENWANKHGIKASYSAFKDLASSMDIILWDALFVQEGKSEQSCQ